MLLKLSSRIDAINKWIGTFAAYLVYVIIAIILYEIIMRSAFNHPTPWVHDTSGWLQVFYVFFGGAWALQRGYLVRVDVLYQQFPARVRAFIDLVITSLLMGLFIWVMIDKGYDFALKSFNRGETPMNGAWEGPVWPAKFAVVIGSLLLGLAWFSKAIRAGYRLVDPSLFPEDDEVEAAG